MNGLVLLSVRSIVTKRMLLYLIYRAHALARELADAAGIESKHVYPYLKPWRRFVEVVKIGSVNLYKATDTLKKTAREVLEMLEESLREARGKMTRKKVLEEARRRFKERYGVEMDEDHALVLEIFVDHALRSSPYIRIDPGKETLPKVLARIIKERYGKDIDEEKLVEILRGLELAKIIYIDRRYYKARLDKSLMT